MALSMTDMTTKNRECRVFEYGKVPVNTAELAETLSYESPRTVSLITNHNLYSLLDQGF